MTFSRLFRDQRGIGSRSSERFSCISRLFGKHDLRRAKPSVRAKRLNHAVPVRLPSGVDRRALEAVRAQDRLTAEAFSAVVAGAPEGEYFRTLARAVAGSAPYGQPVDFAALVRELAKLEQRVADIEADRG